MYTVEEERVLVRRTSDIADDQHREDTQKREAQQDEENVGAVVDVDEANLAD